MSCNYNTKIVTDGLLHYFDASDLKSYIRSGSAWNDRVSGGNATLFGNPSFSDDGNGSISFVPNDYGEVPWGANVNPYNNPITISCWFKLNTLTTGDMLFSTGQDRGNFNFNQRLYFGTVSSTRFGWGIQGVFWGVNDFPTTTTDLEWHNVTVVIDSVSARCYIDNVLGATKSVNNSYVLNDNLYLTKHDIDSTCINAKIANFIIVNKAWTVDQMTVNYNALRVRFGK